MVFISIPEWSVLMVVDAGMETLTMLCTQITLKKVLTDIRELMAIQDHKKVAAGWGGGWGEY